MYVRCRASAVPYDYWGMGKEERSRMEDRKEYQHSVRLLRSHAARGSPLNHRD
jgi:hypothetical protein